MIADFFQRLGEKAHHLWQPLPLKGLGVPSAGLPMLAVVASAILALYGNQSRMHMETAVTRHFTMVERLNELLVLMLNAETGLRGHLLTQRTEFLEPYALAQRSLPGELARLQRFIEAEPGEEPRLRKGARLEQIRATVARELTPLDTLRNTSSTEKSAEKNGVLSMRLNESKETMDTLRHELSEMQKEEKGLLAQRLAESHRRPYSVGAEFGCHRPHGLCHYGDGGEFQSFEPPCMTDIADGRNSVAAECHRHFGRQGESRPRQQAIGQSAPQQANGNPGWLLAGPGKNWQSATKTS